MAWKFPRRFSRAHCMKKTCKQMGFTERSSCRPYKNCFRGGMFSIRHTRSNFKKVKTLGPNSTRKNRVEHMKKDTSKKNASIRYNNKKKDSS